MITVAQEFFGQRETDAAGCAGDHGEWLVDGFHGYSPFFL
jgi:hypothetical protein